MSRGVGVRSPSRFILSKKLHKGLPLQQSQYKSETPTPREQIYAWLADPVRSIDNTFYFVLDTVSIDTDILK